MSRKTLAEQLAAMAANLAEANLKIDEAAKAIEEATKRWAEYDASKKAQTIYIGDGFADSPRFERQRAAQKETK